jgi:hypothetical protein
MKKSLLITSLVCSALVIGCKDGGGDTSPTTPTTPTNPTNDDDGNSETGVDGTTTNGTNPATSDPDPTTGGGPTNPSTDTGDDTAPPATTFLIMPDGGGGECDVFAQDCMDGEKCSAYADDGGNSWNNTKCVPVMENPAQPGDECFVEGNGVSGIDNCDKGSYCWDTDAENMGTCVELCTGSAEAPSCTDLDTLCVIVNEGVLNLCLTECDPLANNCPQADDLCLPQPQGEGFVCVLDASGDTGAKYDDCGFANACDLGNGCFNPAASMGCNADSEGCCLNFCPISEGDVNCNTGNGEDCVPYFEEGTAPPSYEDVGVCAIPA